MKNNVYVRSKKSIKNISITRLLCLLPLIIYGLYKNGIYLYINHYTTIIGLFKPLIYIIIGGIIGALVNIIYEKVIKRREDSLFDMVFSSFHVEYGILLGCITSINTNIIIFTISVLGIFILSKFIKNRVNVMSIVFILIYLLQVNILGSYSFLNAYDTSRVFTFDFMDYMVGRGQGGIATTHIILLIISLIGISITNNNKSNITLSSILGLFVVFGVYSIINKVPLGSIILNNNYMFVCVYILTDYVTSSYTLKGEVIYGLLFSVLTLLFYFINPYLAPFISVVITSLLNNLIDRIANKLTKQ